jgi:Dullard-like phosphatase family protein
LASKREEKFRLNLDNVIKVEQALHRVLESVVSRKDQSHSCIEYWRAAEEAGLYRVEVTFMQTLFRDHRKRQVMREAQVVEALAVFLTHSLSLACPLLELLVLVEHNYYSLIKCILQRVSPQGLKNSRTSTLRSLIEEKLPSNKNPIEDMQFRTARSKSLIEEVLPNVPGPVKAVVIEVLSDLAEITVPKAKRLMDDVKALGSLEDEQSTSSAEPTALLPPTSARYTLVLDLDETLVHYVEIGDEAEVLIRPYCCEFLAEMSQHYELVIFTAGLQDYADWVLDQLDTERYIKHRLYRNHTVQDGNAYLKDLSRLGRDLASTIIVDNVAENFKLQPENGIFIKSWFDDTNDDALQQLAPLLRSKRYAAIATQGVRDVRRALRNLRDQMVRLIAAGCENPLENLAITED